MPVLYMKCATRAYCNGNLENWDVYLKYFSFCCNITKSTTSDLKFSRYELTFRHPVNLPNEIVNKINPVYNLDNYWKELKFRFQIAHKETAAILEKIKARSKVQYDKSIHPVSFKIGDKIKIQKDPYDKFKHIHQGSFEMVEINEPNVTVNMNGQKYIVHKNRILRYYSMVITILPSDDF